MKYQFEDILQKDTDGSWHWNLPQQFNIAEACVDQHTGTLKATQAALIIENETLGQSSVTYDEDHGKA